MIAHRLSSIRNVDEILVVEDGKVTDVVPMMNLSQRIASTRICRIYTTRLTNGGYHNETKITEAFFAYRQRD